MRRTALMMLQVQDLRRVSRLLAVKSAMKSVA
jgi:hypothetical protein